MTEQLYRVQFNVECPVSREDYRDMVEMTSATSAKHYEEFYRMTRHHAELELQTRPLSLERATLIKLRFNGTMTKFDG